MHKEGQRTMKKTLRKRQGVKQYKQSVTSTVLNISINPQGTNSGEIHTKGLIGELRLSMSMFEILTKNILIIFVIMGKKIQEEPTLPDLLEKQKTASGNQRGLTSLFLPSDSGSCFPTPSPAGGRVSLLQLLFFFYKCCL